MIQKVIAIAVYNHTMLRLLIICNYVLQSTSRTSAARKLFEEKQDSNAGKYNSRFTKSVEMPVKKLSIGGQLNEDMLKKVEVKPAASPVNVRARANTINVAENKENTGSPSWMSIAQVSINISISD